MNYYEANVQRIIMERKEAKAKREEMRPVHEFWICPKMKISYMPFRIWLYYMVGITDISKLRKWELWRFYCDYQCDCKCTGVDYESPKVWGIDNPLFD